jgi:hypothetical protein
MRLSDLSHIIFPLDDPDSDLDPDQDRNFKDPEHTGSFWISNITGADYFQILSVLHHPIYFLDIKSVSLANTVLPPSLISVKVQFCGSA